MPGVSLRALIGQKSASMQVITTLCGSLGAEICIVDPSGKVLLGELPGVAYDSVSRYPIVAGEAEIGSVIGVDHDPQRLPGFSRIWPIANRNSARLLQRPSRSTARFTSSNNSLKNSRRF